MSSNIIFFDKISKLIKSILPATLGIGLTLLITAGDAASGTLHPKISDTKLGEYLAGRHALFINDSDSAVRFIRSRAK